MAPENNGIKHTHAGMTTQTKITENTISLVSMAVPISKMRGDMRGTDPGAIKAGILIMTMDMSQGKTRVYTTRGSAY